MSNLAEVLRKPIPGAAASAPTNGKPAIAGGPSGYRASKWFLPGNVQFHASERLKLNNIAYSEPGIETFTRCFRTLKNGNRVDLRNPVKIKVPTRACIIARRRSGSRNARVLRTCAYYDEKLHSVHPEILASIGIAAGMRAFAP